MTNTLTERFVQVETREHLDNLSAGEMVLLEGIGLVNCTSQSEDEIELSCVNDRRIIASYTAKKKGFANRGVNGISFPSEDISTSFYDAQHHNGEYTGRLAIIEGAH